MYKFTNIKKDEGGKVRIDISCNPNDTDGIYAQGIGPILGALELIFGKGQVDFSNIQKTTPIPGRLARRTH